MMNVDLRFKAPFTCLIAGASGSGKSFTTFNLLRYRNEMIDEQFEKVFYCLPENHQISIPTDIQRDSRVIFNSGLINFEEFPSGGKNHFLVVLDDLMMETNSSMLDLFCRQSHHKNISVIFIVQNILFGGSKLFHTISLNSHYILVMKNPRDRNQISVLAQQVLPENARFIKEAFADATREPFHYLLFDLSQTCADNLRFRTKIFPCDSPQNIIYVSTVE